jgi:hypothetical protein
VESQSAERNRLLKVLETANIKLSSVATDVFGTSGRLMLRALIEGKNTPEEMAELAKRKLRSKIPQLELALEGKLEEERGPYCPRPSGSPFFVPVWADTCAGPVALNLFQKTFPSTLLNG